MTNACPPIRSKKSLHWKIVPIPLIVCGMRNYKDAQETKSKFFTQNSTIIQFDTTIWLSLRRHFTDGQYGWDSFKRLLLGAAVPLLPHSQGFFLREWEERDLKTRLIPLYKHRQLRAEWHTAIRILLLTMRVFHPHCMRFVRVLWRHICQWNLPVVTEKKKRFEIVELASTIHVTLSVYTRSLI